MHHICNRCCHEAVKTRNTMKHYKKKEVWCQGVCELLSFFFFFSLTTTLLWFIYCKGQVFNCISLSAA